MNYKKLSKIADAKASVKTLIRVKDSEDVEPEVKLNGELNKLKQYAKRLKADFEYFEGEWMFHFLVEDRDKWERTEMRFGDKFYDLGLDEEFDYDVDDSARCVTLTLL